MERACACMDESESDGLLTVLVDFTNYSVTSQPGLRTLHAAIQILQSHYPERLGEAFLIKPPLSFSTLSSALLPFLSVATRQKLITCKGEKDLLERTFFLDTVEKCVGGENEIPFNSSIFLNDKVDGVLFGAEFDSQLNTHSLQDW